MIFDPLITFYGQLEALLHKDRKYGNNKRVAQETYSKGRDE